MFPLEKPGGILVIFLRAGLGDRVVLGWAGGSGCSFDFCEHFGGQFNPSSPKAANRNNSHKREGREGGQWYLVHGDAWVPGLSLARELSVLLHYEGLILQHSWGLRSPTLSSPTLAPEVFGGKKSEVG